MATPKDNERIAAFRRWAVHIGHAETARTLANINPRTFERMRAGRQPPPPRLLEELADATNDASIAAALRDAAAPAGVFHA